MRAQKYQQQKTADLEARRSSLPAGLGLVFDGGLEGLSGERAADTSLQRCGACDAEELSADQRAARGGLEAHGGGDTQELAAHAEALHERCNGFDAVADRLALLGCVLAPRAAPPDHSLSGEALQG
eukprot:96651-Rhodomonas_salina.1